MSSTGSPRPFSIARAGKVPWRLETSTGFVIFPIFVVVLRALAIGENGAIKWLDR